jgi:3-hydroxyacyl-CoA dehydrogenase
MSATPSTSRVAPDVLAGRSINHVVVLGANGTMGYGSAGLFTQAVPRVTFLARSRDKAAEGVAAAVKQVRSSSLATRTDIGDYDHDLDRVCGEADLIFEALAEDIEIKKPMFERVDAARRPDSIVATVTSGISINALAAGRSESFRRNFLGLHFFNPPNVIVGTELIAGNDTDPAVVEFIEAFAQIRLGREMVRTKDTPAFAGNRVGFKVLNEAAQLAEQLGVETVERIIGPYTGRALTPLATIDLVGWDVHQAIVDNVYANSNDEAHETLKMPAYMAAAIAKGVLGDKAGGGFFKKAGKDRLVLDPATGDYAPAAGVHRDDLGYIADVSRSYATGRYKEGMAKLLAAPGEAAAIARKVMAGYIAYSFERVGEVCDSITEIDRIMGAGFNWAPPSVLVDAMGAAAAVKLIEGAGLAVPSMLGDAASAGRTAPFFVHPTMNPGRFFVAA